MTTVSFNQGLDRRIVHRSSNASVLLTSLRDHQPGAWILGAQVPRGHILGRPNTGRDVPLLFGVEVLRQSGLAVAHEGFDIPIGHPFTMRDLSFAWVGTAPTYPAFGPLEAEARVTVIEVIKRQGQTTGLRITLSLRDRNGQLAEGGGLLHCLSPQQYRMFRRSAPDPRNITSRFDDAPLREIHASSGELVALMGWNHTDPFIFDHPTDHVPGIAMLQSAIYAAQQLSDGYAVRGISMNFQRFLEFDPVPRVHARTVNQGLIEVVLTQGDNLAAAGMCDVSQS